MAASPCRASILRDASLRDAPQDEAVLFGSLRGPPPRNVESCFMTREPAITGLPLPFDLAGRRIFVAGHRGMVGAALVRRLKSERCEVLTADRRVLDLTRQADTADWLRDNRPDVVIVAAARVGGDRKSTRLNSSHDQR